MSAVTTLVPTASAPAAEPAAAERRWTGWASFARRHGFLLTWLALAVGLSVLPLALAACCAPPGATGLGTVWFINDFAQYESAMAQGARGAWLVHDPFTAEPQSAAFMFALYVLIGHLSALGEIPALALERAVEVGSRVLLVLALWRFTHAFTRSEGAARAAFLLALFGSGVGFLVVVFGTLARLGPLYGGSYAYETNGLGLLFAAPHVPLAMAGSLELAGWLRRGQAVTHGKLAVALLLGAGVALLQPFHLPVLLAALLLVGLFWARTGAGTGTLLAGAAATLGALPALVPTVVTFTLDPFWGATYTRQNVLPSPAPHELLVDLGVTLVLALGGLWFQRGRAAPFGLLVWTFLALAAMYLPVPYQRRLAFGLEPALAVIAGNALVALCASVRPRWAAAARLATVALAASGTVLVAVSIVESLLIPNGPLPVYRSTTDLDAAARWLNARVQPNQVILADWDVSNDLAPRTRGRVMGGHPVATLDPAGKKLLILTFFAHQGNLSVARALGASWVVYGPAERALPHPAQPPAFQQGAVAVYAVPGAPS